MIFPGLENRFSSSKLSNLSAWFLASVLVLSSFLTVPGTLQAAEDSVNRSEGVVAERYPEDYQSPGRQAPEGKEIRKYAVDDSGPGATNFGVAPVHDDPWFATVRSDRLEWRASEETPNSVLLWDVSAWVGDDEEKLYVESEGEWEEDHSEAESATVELLYGRSMSAFWDLRFGLRQDLEPEPERAFGVIGLTGIAPQWVETDLNLNVGETGDYRMDLESEYNLFLSQRLIVQPRLETEFAFRDQPELALGDGFTGLELGTRLRYEFHRKFAPYLGLSWESDLGETRDITQRAGSDPDAFFAVVGVKFWY